MTLASLRDGVAMVSQEITLFDDTIRANIAPGPARGRRRGDRGGRQGGRGARVHHGAARRLRHGDRRGRPQAVRRAAPAPRAGARHPQGRADPAARRGDQRARHRIGEPGAGGAGALHAQPHHAGHRPPAVDRAAGRHDLRDGGRAAWPRSARTPSCSPATASTRGCAARRRCSISAARRPSRGDARREATLRQSRLLHRPPKRREHTSRDAGVQAAGFLLTMPTAGRQERPPSRGTGGASDMASAEPKPRLIHAAIGRLLARYIRFVGTSSHQTAEMTERFEEHATTIPASSPCGTASSCCCRWSRQPGYRGRRHAGAPPRRRADGRRAARLRHAAHPRSRRRRARRKDRGGVHAFRAAVQALREGRSVGMTADVPAAARRGARASAWSWSRAPSGRPIMPLAIATSRYVALNTWSRMTAQPAVVEPGLCQSARSCTCRAMPATSSSRSTGRRWSDR